MEQDLQRLQDSIQEFQLVSKTVADELFMSPAAIKLALKVWESTLSFLGGPEVLDERQVDAAVAEIPEAQRYFVKRLLAVENQVWKRYSSGKDFYLRFPFFLVGQKECPERFASSQPPMTDELLHLRRQIGVRFQKTSYLRPRLSFAASAKEEEVFSEDQEQGALVLRYEYDRALSVRYERAEYELSELFERASKIFFTSPYLITHTKAPRQRMYPKYMERDLQVPSKKSTAVDFWQRECQSWELGPAANTSYDDQLVYIGLIDNENLELRSGKRSVFRQLEISISEDLGEELYWPSLCDCLLENEEVFVRYVKELVGDPLHPRAVLLVDLLRDPQKYYPLLCAVRHIEPEPSLDVYHSREKDIPFTPEELLRRLTQDLGASKIRSWVRGCRVGEYWLVTEHHAVPMTKEHAENLLEGSICHLCGEIFYDEGPMQSVTMAPGVHIRHFGYNSRYHNFSVGFFGECNGELCDSCVEEEFRECRALHL